MKIVNFAGFQAEARKRLPSFLYEYIDGGSYDEHTLCRNVEDFKSVVLRQRVFLKKSINGLVDGALSS